jgi:hypothetical protein
MYMTENRLATLLRSYETQHKEQLDEFMLRIYK